MYVTCAHVHRYTWLIHSYHYVFLSIYISMWFVLMWTCIRDSSIRIITSSSVYTHVCELCTWIPVYMTYPYVSSLLPKCIHMYVSCAHIYLCTWLIHTYHYVFLSIYICMWLVHKWTCIHDVSIRIMTSSYVYTSVFDLCTCIPVYVTLQTYHDFFLCSVWLVHIYTYIYMYISRFIHIYIYVYIYL